MSIPIGVLDILAPEIEDDDSDTNNDYYQNEQMIWQHNMLYHVVKAVNDYVTSQVTKHQKKKKNCFQHSKSADSLFKLALQNSYVRKHTF